VKVCDKTCIFFFFPIINKYFLMAKRSLLYRCPSYKKTKSKYSSPYNRPWRPSLTSALNGGEWSKPRPGHFIPVKRTGAHFRGGWVGPRASLDEWKVSHSTGSDTRTVQSVTGHDIDRAVPAHRWTYKLLLTSKYKF